MLTGGASALTVTVDGRTLEAPIREGGVTYAPLRELLAAFGIGEVSWDSASRSARAETGLFSLSVPVGKWHLLAEGYAYDLSAPAMIRQGKTYVPLRPVASLLGGRVGFTGWDRPITVTTGTAVSHTPEDLYWLSRIISAESRGEGLLGQIAVGNVVMNRVASAEFPDSIKAVVFDRKDAVQFEPVANGTIYLEPTEQSVLAAQLVLQGADAVGDCLYFFNPSLSQGTWIQENRTYFTTIGCHRFYR